MNRRNAVCHGPLAVTGSFTPSHKRRKNNTMENPEITPKEELVARTRLLSARHESLPEADHLVLPKIDWSGVDAFRPEPLSLDVPPREWKASRTLPAADVVVMTWTVAEWAALNHVFCDYDREMTMSRAYEKTWRGEWYNYSRNYYQIRQYMEDVYKTYQGGAPSRSDEAWGQFRMVSINGLRVMLLKSAMHLAQDGSELPLTRFVDQVCAEASPRLVLSIGTAGGVRAEDALGCALVTNQAYFHLLKEFANAEFNGTTVHSTWVPNEQFIPEAQERVMQVPGLPVYPLSPQYPADAVILPDAPDSRIKVVTDQPIITTDTFLFGTTDNGLEQYGCIVEMDDAVVGLVCERQGVGFGFVRNVSDPVINGKLPAQLQDAWAGYIYKERGLFTSYNGALAAWALVAGESATSKEA